MKNAKSYSVALGLIVLAAQPASAADTLKDFLVAGRQHAIGNREALVNTEISSARADENFWRLFPSVSASGGYTYNSNQSVVSTVIGGVQQYVTIAPHNQFDASFTVNVPLFDLQAIYKYRASKAGYSQSRVDVQVAAQQNDLQITRAFYTYMAAVNEVSVDKRHVDALNSIIALAQRKVDAGAAQSIEIDRAKVELVRLQEAQSEAQVRADAAKRSLLMYTGQAPSATSFAVSSDLPVEDPVDNWLAQASRMPSVQSAEGGLNVAEANVSAARSAYLPKLSLTGNDHLTNNYGFQDSPNSYTIGLTATINFDLSMPATVREQEQNRAMARLKVEEALDNAREMISAAYDQVTVQRARCDSQHDTVEVYRHAAELAFERYSSGLATEDELLRAQHDLIGAEQVENTALAEFQYDRALLRVVSGQDLTRASSL